MIFLWSIQYFGNPDIPDKFTHFNHIFQILAELDPRWVDPYEVGALIALYDAKDVPLAISILDLGLAKNPDLWIFPLEAGHYAQLLVKDNDLARVYYKKAMDIPGSPPIVKRLYANAAFKTLDYDTAWATWREVFETSADEAVRKIASNHLYNIKSTVDGQAVRNAVFDFRTRAGRNPSSLDELVRAGLLREVPRDLDGRDYVYDPADGNDDHPGESMEALILIGLFGLCWGSFLNVVIHRLPRGLNLSRPPSACPACGARIRPWDNIPVLSYILLGGRCRACRVRVSPRYIFVELLTPALLVVDFLRFGPGLPFFAAALLTSALIVLAFIDYDHKLLPDAVVLPTAALGLLYALVREDMSFLAGACWARPSGRGFCSSSSGSITWSGRKKGWAWAT